MKFGIVREGKMPPDKRVPLSPKQCKLLKGTYPGIELVVQPSPIRAFKDEEYRAEGISLQEDLADCDVLMGVKEVPLDMLIPDKTYLFFSHTYKRQEYNRELLRTILRKKVRLIDYEMLKEPGGKRLLGFGRYAGIVGVYNAFRAWGEWTGDYKLKPAHQCEDRRELERELIKVDLPADMRIILTGAGRVAGGAMEMLSALRMTHVFPEEFLGSDFPEPVFCQLDIMHYYERKDGKSFVRKDFYNDPDSFRSVFMKYAGRADMYLPCHFWSNRSPYIFTREDARAPGFRIKIVSDISCDINGPVASTLRASAIADPFYGYDPIKEKEVPFGTEGSIGVSAVDNLPCELPRDASEDFGNELMKKVMPLFFNGDEHNILEKASETDLEGKLTPHFSYLEDYVGL